MVHLNVHFKSTSRPEDLFGCNGGQLLSPCSVHTKALIKKIQCSERCGPEFQQEFPYCRARKSKLVQRKASLSGSTATRTVTVSQESSRLHDHYRLSS
jgi:hypothetical protein